MNSIIGFVEFVIGAIVVLIALVLILLVVISRMPADNPLRQVLSLLIARIGAAAGALAITIEPIPGPDLLYDIGTPACSSTTGTPSSEKSVLPGQNHRQRCGRTRPSITIRGKALGRAYAGRSPV
jgi:hypothetical protein